uniref:PFU domain-containing protein n=1 Tax=Rhabditophanes sp. KR3021 TaxID=114890 RepID=A0AC35UEJ7_9BILA
MWQSGDPSVYPDSTYTYSLTYDIGNPNVRYIDVNAANVIVAGSRDGSIQAIFEDGTSEDKPMFKTGHKKFMNGNCAVHSVATWTWEEENMHVIVCGYRDGSTRFYNHTGNEDFLRFYDHSAAVCVVNINKDSGQVTTGGWDSRAFVYGLTRTSEGSMTWKKMNDLIGHTMSVWDARSLGHVCRQLTASADKTIKLWENGECLATYEGYPDILRQALSFEDYLLGTGNDPVISCFHFSKSDGPHKTFETKCESHINTMEVFKHTKTDKNYLVVGGELGFYEVFTASQTSDDIHLLSLCHGRLPVTSIWKAIFMPIGSFYGDIVFATENGPLIVLTLTTLRRAKDDDAAKFIGQTIEFNEIQDALREKHDNPEYFGFTIQNPDGSGDMQIKYKSGDDPAETVNKFIVHNNLPKSSFKEVYGFLIEHCASAAAYVTEKKNRILGKNDDIQKVKVMYEGKGYDYLFDVSLGDKQVKIPYNIGEDPSEVSQTFCEKHGLNIGFMKKMCDFLYEQVPELASKTRPGKASLNNAEAARPSNCGLPITVLKKYDDFEGPNTANLIKKLTTDNTEYDADSKSHLSGEELSVLTSFLTSKDPSTLINHVGLIENLLLRKEAHLTPVFHLIYLASTCENLAVKMDHQFNLVELMKNIVIGEKGSVNSFTMILRAFANLCHFEYFLKKFQEEKMTFANLALAQATASKQVTQDAALNFLLNFVVVAGTIDLHVSEIANALILKFADPSKCGLLSPGSIEGLLKVWAQCLWNRPAVIRACAVGKGPDVIRILKDKNAGEVASTLSRTVFNMLQRAK